MALAIRLIIMIIILINRIGETTEIHTLYAFLMSCGCLPLGRPKVV